METSEKIAVAIAQAINDGDLERAAELRKQWNDLRFIERLANG